MRRKALFLVVIIAILLTGCFGRERVMIEPRVNLGSKIAVLYFYNFTDDPLVTKEVEDALVNELSQYYRVLKPIDAERAMVDLRLRRGETPSARDAVRLGKKLNVDSIIYGEVTGYFDPITELPASVVETRVNKHGETEYKWQTGQVTQVMISFSGKVIDAETGAVIYRNRVKAEKEQISNRTLHPTWWEEGKVPSRWDIPSINRHDVSAVRRNALNQAIKQFTPDLMPTYMWRKIEK